MKRVLIISELFAPQNLIGALRPTKLRKHLIQRGYCVDVITKAFSNQKESGDNGRIWRICTEKSNSSKGVTLVATHRKNRLLLELKRAKRTWLSVVRSQSYCKQVVDFVKESNINISDYNAVITTFGPISSIMIGLKLKKTFPDINWICDFRDPMVVEEVSIFFKPIMSWIQSNACKNADHIVAVSNGYINRICGNKYISKRHMIPNGYDVSDLAVSEFCTSSPDIFHIVYVGTMYEGKRKITPLFRVLRELCDEKTMDVNKICFDYAGGDGAFLRKQADEFALSDIICDHKVLSRDECLKLQFSSHLLVLSTWNNRGEEGVFPGKFLEYMLIGHPIISLVDGNIPDAEVTAVMREGQFGIAYESVSDKKDSESLKEYIKKSYLEWMDKGTITFTPNQEVLERYNYTNIIKRIEELFYE